MNKNTALRQAELSLRAAERTMERAMARIEQIANRPDEPMGNPEDGIVVFFQRTFGGVGTVYTYAMVKAGDGKWYTTGPRSPKGYTWDEVLDWLEDDLVGDLWIATEFGALA
jgi:hypothetical protein